MPIVAVIQQKGGVGKSTIVVNLVGELVQAQRTVTAFDLDPQRTLAKWALRGEGVLKPRVQAMEVNNHRLFERTVKGAQEDWEYVLLDCPAGFSAAALSAALVADLVLVPVTPSPVDLLSAKDAREMIHTTRGQRGGGELPRLAFVPSRLVHNNWSRTLVENLQAFGEMVMPSISQRTAIISSFVKGQTLREFAGRSKGIGDFQDLADAVQRTAGVK